MRIAIISNKLKFITIFTIIALIVFAIIFSVRSNAATIKEFDGKRAYEDIEYQVGLGPRTMGSIAHDKATSWIINNLTNQHWLVETQETVISGVTIKNIIAKRGEGNSWIIIGSHYDSRAIADRDPILANRTQPVMGANDGASTVAILLELARILPQKMDKQIWLVFFDDEDNGAAYGSGWSVGSTYFVDQLKGKPDSVVILDMLGDKDLNIYMEGNSNHELNNQIWDVAKELGYAQFIAKYKNYLTDDHIPFLEAGIKAVDIIDIDYPYWHTTHDTLDKVSAESLQVVGNTMVQWLEQYPVSTNP
jgi:glutaminyl-peptide cyclotransferase